MEKQNTLRKKETILKSIILNKIYTVKEIKIILEERNLSIPKKTISNYINIKRGIIDKVRKL